MQADRNLLFGILALQNDVVSRDQLVEAMNAWVLEKQTSLADLFERKGFLAGDCRTLLDALVDKQLERHAGNLKASVAAFASIEKVRTAFARVDDDDVRSLTESWHTETDVPATIAVFERSTDATGRFTILRPHAAGGLCQRFGTHAQQPCQSSRT